MMTEIKEMMETIAKHRNLLDTDDLAQRGTMLMGAYPELLVNLLSRFALGVCHDRSVVFHDFQRLYNKYTDICLQYAPEYLTYPIHGIDAAHTRKVVEQTQIGVLLFTFWCGVYKDWDRQKNTGKSKKVQLVPAELEQDVTAILYNVLGSSGDLLKEKAKAGEEDIIAYVLNSRFRGCKKVLRKDILQVMVVALLLIIKEAPVQFQKNSEWLKAFWLDLMTTLIWYKMETLIGEKGQKEQSWMTDTKKCYYNVYQCKCLDDIRMDSEFQDDGEAEVRYYDMLHATLLMFGLQSEDASLSKQERTEVFSVLGANTYLNGEGGLSKQDQERAFVYEVSVYNLSKKAATQAKEKILFMIRTEARERKAAEVLDRAEKTAKSIGSLQEEVKKERETKESFQKQLKEQERQGKEYYKALTVARNKLDAKEERLKKLEQEVRALQKALAEKEEIHEERNTAEAIADITEDVSEPLLSEEKKNVPTTEEMLKSIQNYCQNHKVICFGGNQNLVKKAQYRYPGLRFIEKTRSTDFYPAICKADLIVFKTDSMSHRVFDKAKMAATQSGVPFAYLETSTSFERLDKSLYEIIQNQEAEK